MQYYDSYMYNIPNHTNNIYHLYSSQAVLCATQLIAHNKIVIIY